MRMIVVNDRHELQAAGLLRRGRRLLMTGPVEAEVWSRLAGQGHPPVPPPTRGEGCLIIPSGIERIRLPITQGQDTANESKR